MIVKTIRSSKLAGQIWILTSLVLGAGWLLYAVCIESNIPPWSAILAAVCAAVGSLPVLLVLVIVLPHIENLPAQRSDKISWLVFISFLCTLPYGLTGGNFFTSMYENKQQWTDYFLCSLAVSGVLFACSVAAMLLTRNHILYFFQHTLNKPIH